MSPKTAPIPPDIPPIPSWSNLKVFLWGALWAVVSGAAPAGVMVYDWLKDWDTPINWGEVEHIALVGVITGLFTYWRKHKALLAPPPNQP